MSTPIIELRPDATVQIAQVNWPEAFAYCPQTTVHITRTDEKLCLSFHVKGLDLRAVYEEDHGQVWTDSCCEFFCRVPGAAHYFNFEINAIGTMTVSTRTARNENVKKLSPEDMQRIARIAPLGRKAWGEKEGEYEWEVGMEIPFSLILQMTDEEWCAAGKPIPEKLECNIYKCGDNTAHPHYVSWAPIHTPSPDFHRPECFGIMVL